MFSGEGARNWCLRECEQICVSGRCECVRSVFVGWECFIFGIGGWVGLTFKEQIG